MKVLKLIVAFIAICGFFAFTYFWLELRAPSDNSQKIIFEVESGSFRHTINKLAEQGFIRNEMVFLAYVKITASGSKVRTGEFEISKNMSARELLNTFIFGKNYERSFTIQEGLNIYEIGELLESKGIAEQKTFINYVTNPKVVFKLIGYPEKSLEGYLYPETYKYAKNINLDKLVAAMVDRLKSVVQEISPQLNENKKMRHQIITLASVIEKETGAPEERPIISSVFYNRIQRNMRLQSDPTIIYGKTVETGSIPKKIHKSDIAEKNEYNTYAINGLPVGPISNPGRDSILAALKPAKTEYLYFVSMNEGRHYFSRTYEEHEKAVTKYQLNPRARAGKSWRDLKKSSARESEH